MFTAGFEDPGQDTESERCPSSCPGQGQPHKTTLSKAESPSLSPNPTQSLRPPGLAHTLAGAVCTVLVEQQSTEEEILSTGGIVIF